MEPVYDEEDTLPEFCHYRDEGCEVSPSCLNCPLAACIYEERGGRRRFVRDGRNAEIKKLYRKGLGTEALSRRFGLSRRSIQRIVREA